MIYANFFMPGGALENDYYQLFGLAHLLWMVIPLLLLIGLCLLIKKVSPRTRKVIVYAVALTMLSLRIIKYYIFKPFIWDEPWQNIVPFELCTIMSFVFPFTVFKKADKLNTYIYPLGIVGGIVTLIYSEWIFNGRGHDFNKFESLVVHWLLIYLPYLRLAMGEFKFKIVHYYRPLVALLILVIYAWIANNYITPGANHMFLVKNPLPIQIPGIHHVFTLGLIGLVLILLLYLPFIKHRHQKPERTQ